MSCGPDQTLLPHHTPAPDLLTQAGQHRRPPQGLHYVWAGKALLLILNSDLKDQTTLNKPTWFSLELFLPGHLALKVLLKSTAPNSGRKGIEGTLSMGIGIFWGMATAGHLLGAVSWRYRCQGSPQGVEWTQFKWSKVLISTGEEAQGWEGKVFHLLLYLSRGKGCHLRLTVVSCQAVLNACPPQS